MSRENRWIVSLMEIHSIRWQCVKCDVAISYGFEKPIRLPAVCPFCNADVVVNDPEVEKQVRNQLEQLQTFITTLERIRSDKAERVGRIQLEFLIGPPTQPGRDVAA
jgi:hypothetical protein